MKQDANTQFSKLLNVNISHGGPPGGTCMVSDVALVRSVQMIQVW